MKLNLESDNSFLEIAKNLSKKSTSEGEIDAHNNSFDDEIDLGSFVSNCSNDFLSLGDFDSQDLNQFEMTHKKEFNPVRCEDDYMHKQEGYLKPKKYESDFMHKRSQGENSNDSLIEVINISNMNTNNEDDSGSSIICNYNSPNLFDLEDEIQLLRGPSQNSYKKYNDNHINCNNTNYNYENDNNSDYEDNYNTNQSTFSNATRNELSAKTSPNRKIITLEDNSDMIPVVEDRAVDILQYYLTNVFHLPNFRPLQRSIVEASLAKKDIFVLMPTGGGKSLTFQLPALIEDGVTIIISPLLSLITDQISQLLSKNILALPINSTLNNTDREMVFSALKENLVKIFYVTPELIMQSNRFTTILDELNRNRKLIRFVLDEAHCIQWGLDFRPDYLNLFSLKKKYNVPFTFLTATATESLISMIQSKFGVKLNFFKSSFNRPNLNYKILKNVNKFKELLSLLLTFNDLTGIIYCLTKKETEMLYSKLKGITKCSFYHAGLNKSERNNIQTDWFNNKIKVIISTIAFGMGIDKKDVRFVIHYTVPKSIENYYQETGRAGRDQLLSYCYLFYDYKDKIKVEKLTKQSISEVVDFVLSRVCRRKYLLKYFGEDFDSALCNKMCDNCCLSKIRVDELAQTVVSCILELQEFDSNIRITRTTLVDILKGSKNKKSLNYSELGTFNKMKNLKKEIIIEIIDALVFEKFLREKLVKSNDFEWNELEVINKKVSGVYIEDIKDYEVDDTNTQSNSGFRKLSNNDIKSSNVSNSRTLTGNIPTPLGETRTNSSLAATIAGRSVSHSKGIGKRPTYNSVITRKRGFKK